jgi:hypothetical protein
LRSKLIFSCLLITLISSVFAGQVKSAKKFSNLRVSPELRQRLADRFNLFVEYERTQQFDKLYDLLPSNVRQRVQREAYVAERQKAATSEHGYGRLLALKVNRIQDRKLRDNEWVGFDVQVKLLMKNGKTYPDQAVSFVAYLQNGDWYFSMVFVEV